MLRKPSKRNISRKKEWATVSSDTDRSNKMRIGRWLEFCKIWKTEVIGDLDKWNFSLVMEQELRLEWGKENMRRDTFVAMGLIKMEW